MNILEVKSVEEFDQLMDKSDDKPILFDFYAEWCGPCKMLTPMLEKLNEKYGEEILIVKVNIEEMPEIAGRFQVRSVPTVATVSKGKGVQGSVGLNSLGYYESMVANLIEEHKKES
tara:strand:- start:1102 stop:1449 length:348 start_codon:yes stop_codon:yes gene_type:complete